MALLALAAAAVSGPVPADMPPAATPAAPAVSAVVEEMPVALLVDLGAGRTLHAKNAELRFQPASMAKVMTAYVAFELIRRGELRREDRFRVAPGTSAEFDASGATMNLRDGEEVSVDQLLQGLLTISANDAAVVLAQGFAGDVPTWCALMNAEARRLGMADSHFATPNGWPDGGKTYVSARDLVRLGEALIYRHPDLYRQYFGKARFDWPRASGRNFDPVTGVVAGADGIKTGHTREAGYNFIGSAERNGRRLIMVVAGGTSAEQRAAASRDLLEWGFSAWPVRPLFAANVPVAEARVQGGAARRVALISPYPVHALLPAEGATLRFRYDGPLVAPVAAGQRVAELEVVVPGQPVGRVPLYAARQVALAGPLDRLGNGLAALLP